MSCGQQASYAVEGLSKVVTSTLLGTPCVQGHAHQHGSQDGGPLLIAEGMLGVYGCMQGIGCCGEGGTEGITHSLEDVTAMPLDGVAKDSVMSLKGSLHLLGVLLP